MKGERIAHVHSFNGCYRDVKGNELEPHISAEVNIKKQW